MARKPSKIIFTCEDCHSNASPRNVRNWQGRCHRCKRACTWTVTVFFIDTETERSVLGTISSFLIGLGWYRMVYHTNTLTAGAISTDVARYLTDTRRDVNDRVTKYVRLRQNQEMQKNGAISCLHCEANFVPSNCAWHSAGYCSRLCATHAGFSEVEPAQNNLSSAGIVSVLCANGHRFNVPSTFCGCSRPCPTCKSKTFIPQP